MNTGVVTSRTLRVLAYARSRDADALAMQSGLLRQYVSDRHGWELVSELSDSNTQQGLDRVLDQARDRTYDVLLVHSLSRLSRRISGLSRIVKLLEAAGVTVHSVTEPVDLKGPSGRFLVSVLAATAEYDRNSRHRHSSTTSAL
jgi:site-specific DNA recombinase